MDGQHWTPKIDLLERENDFLIKAELSEVFPSDIEINIEGRTLTIRGERSFEEPNATRTLIERKYGCFTRKIELPPLIDMDNIVAELDGGLLFILLPKGKVDITRTRKIEIK